MSFFILLEIGGGILVFVWDFSWIVPITPAVMVIRGLTFQPTSLSVWMSGLYLLDLSLMIAMGNLSWEYVNSMIWIIFNGLDSNGGWLSLRAPIKHWNFGRR
jgi:hypothetical protein